jgi:hypothetical protein
MRRAGEAGRGVAPRYSNGRIVIILFLLLSILFLILVFLFLFLLRAALTQKTEAWAEWFQKKHMIPEKAHGSRKSSRFQKKLTVPEKAHSSTEGCPTPPWNHFGAIKPSSCTGRMVPDRMHGSTENAWFHGKCMVPQRMHHSRRNALFQGCWIPPRLGWRGSVEPILNAACRWLRP